MSVAGVLLLASLRVRFGPLARTLCAGAVAATAAALVGLFVARLSSGGGTAQAVAGVVVAGGLAAIAGVVVLLAVARDALRSVLGVLRR
jgi:hypothetical protein